ncbi:MAG: ABC transporter substrate-binding protein [Phycisphaerales bacterium JB039]
MSRTLLLIGVSLAVILGVPLALRPGGAEGPPAGARTLIVITPHTAQIRREFADGFNIWHQAHYGEPVAVDYRVPGGTSEIMRLLEDQYRAALRQGAFEIGPGGEIVMARGTVQFDLMFGGGSYDHGRLKSGVREEIVFEGERTEVSVPMSTPVGIDPDVLETIFGPNRVGAQPLYDPEQYWIGVAMSSFGIVFNRDELRALGLAEPTSFEDLTDPRLVGRIALADPRQSGSITTTFDSILNNYGWDDGWRILREMCANARSFSSSSTKPPIDVAQAEAVMGLAIDFYGRAQAEAVGGGRVGYAEPSGAVYIDPDPVSVLRGGPSPELARRFVEYCMSEEAQALWQFPPVDQQTPAEARGGLRRADGEAAGPRRWALRRLPARRIMYEQYAEVMVDHVDPFAAASPVESRGWRSAIGLMMGAFGVDTVEEARAAWTALAGLREQAGAGAVSRELVERAEAAFYAFPPTRLPDGQVLPFAPETYRQVRDAWREPDESNPNRIGAGAAKIAYTKFFQEQYRLVLRIEREARGE